jgi:EmrB/QacA subfamily drug resistance transporter
LALCALLLNAGRLADRVGRKRVFIAGTAAFGLSSAGCALAGSPGELIAWRAVQGVGGAMLLPSSLAILRASFPARELDRAVGAWAAASTASVVAGPIVGGLLVEYVSWQSVFLINVPIALVALAGAIGFVAESRGEHASGSLDAPGVALGSGGVFLLVFALINAGSHGWGSAYTLGLFAVAFALLVLFIARERTAKEPMLPLELFHRRAFSAAAGANVVTYISLYGVLFFWTLYLQRVLGDSPLTSGVHLLPLTLGFVGTSPLAGLLGSRFGPRMPLLAGLLGIASGSMLLTFVRIEDGYGGVWPALLLLGVSLALAAVACVQTLMSNAPLRHAGSAGAVTTTACQLGGLLGIAVLGSVLASHATATVAHELIADGVSPRLATQLALHAGPGTAHALPAAHVPASLTRQVAGASPRAFVDGLRAAMWVSAAIALLGALLARFVGRGEGNPGPVGLV